MRRRKGRPGSHRSPSGGKSSACQGATQVVTGVAMTARKPRTAELEGGCHLSRGQTLAKKMPGHPQVHNIPVGGAEALGDTPAVQTILVSGSGLCRGQRGATGGTGRIGCIDRQPRWLYQFAGGLQQDFGLGSKTSTGMDNLDPRCEAAQAPMTQFLIRETSQSAQVTPVGTAQV